MKIKIKDTFYNLENRVLLMGILNATPDSFSDGGKFQHEDSIKYFIDEAHENRIDIIDIGGESTRPSADKIDVQEELDRVLPVIELIQSYSDIALSIDSYKSKVAESAIRLGVNMVNDISAGHFDKKMFETIAKYNLPYVMMHIKGNPKNMQKKTIYSNLFDEITTYFTKQITVAEDTGIKTIIIDPGIGFGKSITDNFKIIQHLSCLKKFNKIILVGASRKSFLAGKSNLEPKEREIGTMVVHAQAIQNGARIIRCHQLKFARQMGDIMESLLNVSLKDS